MTETQTGKLILQKMPGGPADKAVIDYMAVLFKNAAPEKVAARMARLPVTLSRNVPADGAQKLIADLAHLGAVAVFSTDVSPPPEPLETPETPEDMDAPTEEYFSREDLEEAILSSFKGHVPHVPLAFSYRLGLLFSAGAMLLLPLFYVGLIGAVGCLLY